MAERLVPGLNVEGVLGRSAGRVVDVAANAFSISGPAGTLWIPLDTVLLVRGGTLVLKCPASFVRQYRIRPDGRRSSG